MSLTIGVAGIGRILLACVRVNGASARIEREERVSKGKETVGFVPFGPAKFPVRLFGAAGEAESGWLGGAWNDSSRQELENALNGIVGLAVSRLNFGGRFWCGVRRRVEQAVGERTADTLVKQDEQESGLVAFV